MDIINHHLFSPQQSFSRSNGYHQPFLYSTHHSKVHFHSPPSSSGRPGSAHQHRGVCRARRSSWAKLISAHRSPNWRCSIFDLLGPSRLWKGCHLHGTIYTCIPCWSVKRVKHKSGWSLPSFTTLSLMNALLEGETHTLMKHESYGGVHAIVSL